MMKNRGGRVKEWKKERKQRKKHPTAGDTEVVEAVRVRGANPSAGGQFESLREYTLIDGS